MDSNHKNDAFIKSNQGHFEANIKKITELRKEPRITQIYSKGQKYILKESVNIVKNSWIRARNKPGKPNKNKNMANRKLINWFRM